MKSLLGSDAEMKKLVAKEIRDDAKKYGDERRTTIEEAGRATFERQVVGRAAHDHRLAQRLGALAPGPRARSVGHHLQDRRRADTRFSRRARCTTSRRIDSTGRAFSVQAADIPGGKGDGVPFTSLIELAPGARLAHVVDAQPGTRYLVANSGGYGFIVESRKTC